MPGSRPLGARSPSPGFGDMQGIIQGGKKQQRKRLSAGFRDWDRPTEYPSTFPFAGLCNKSAIECQFPRSCSGLEFPVSVVSKPIQTGKEETAALPCAAALLPGSGPRIDLGIFFFLFFALFPDCNIRKEDVVVNFDSSPSQAWSNIVIYGSGFFLAGSGAKSV